MTVGFEAIDKRFAPEEGFERLDLR